MTVKANVGSVDRVIRIVIGIVLLLLLFFLEGNLKYIGLIGVIPILTAFISFCPIYALFKISTKKHEY